jgi:hypothetical protein
MIARYASHARETLAKVNPETDSLEFGVIET